MHSSFRSRRGSCHRHEAQHGRRQIINNIHFPLFPVLSSFSEISCWQETFGATQKLRAAITSTTTRGDVPPSKRLEETRTIFWRGLERVSPHLLSTLRNESKLISNICYTEMKYTTSNNEPIPRPELFHLEVYFCIAWKDPLFSSWVANGTEWLSGERAFAATLATPWKAFSLFQHLHEPVFSCHHVNKSEFPS